MDHMRVSHYAVGYIMKNKRAIGHQRLKEKTVGETKNRVYCREFKDDVTLLSFFFFFFILRGKPK